MFDAQAVYSLSLDEQTLPIRDCTIAGQVRFNAASHSEYNRCYSLIGKVVQMWLLASLCQTSNYSGGKWFPLSFCFLWERRTGSMNAPKLCMCEFSGLEQ